MHSRDCSLGQLCWLTTFISVFYSFESTLVIVVMNDALDLKHAGFASTLLDEDTEVM